MSEINIDNKEWKEYILTRPLSELTILWKKYWTGTDREFCEINNINRSNFNKCLRGTKASTMFIIYVRKYLLSLCPDIVINENDLLKEILTLPETISQLTKKIKEGKVDKIIMIDGDNSAQALDILHSLSLKGKKFSTIQVVAVFTSLHRASKACLVSFYDWFNEMKSYTLYKEAVDCALNSLMISLHHQIPNDIQYILITSDTMGYEIVACLNSLGRKSYKIKSENLELLLSLED